MTRRYAIYFSPAQDSRWFVFGQEWLMGRWKPASVSIEAWSLMSRAPARYGWHATLKAPFRLKDSYTEASLLRRVQVLSESMQSVPLHSLEPVVMSGYVALIPNAPANELKVLNEQANRCVVELDDLRAPLTEQDLNRRNADQLDGRARELLNLYGYPHVMERFRFHMTLATVNIAEEAKAILAELSGVLPALHAHEPPVFDRLCVFVEPAVNQPFERIGEFVFTG